MIQITLNEPGDSIFRNNVLPYLIHVSEINNEPKWAHPMHMHNNYSEIVYVKDGKGNVIIGSDNYEVKKGDILIYNKGILHHEKSSLNLPLNTYVCGVGNIYIKDVEDNCILPSNVVPVIKSGKYSHQIESYFINMFEESTNQVEGFELICQNILSALIILIKRIVSIDQKIIEQDTQGSLAYRIKEYIDQNYMYDISLKDIAEEFYISPYYLGHILKNEIGFSPIRYIINRRLGEAQNLLLTTNLSVSEISKKVGYDNVNYFNILFKKNIGTSPGRFRDASTVTSPGME